MLQRVTPVSIVGVLVFGMVVFTSNVGAAGGDDSRGVRRRAAKEVQPPKVASSARVHGDHGPMGACCLPDGGCADLSGHECMNAAGTPYGLGTSCETIDCASAPTRACCLPDDACTELPGYECMNAGGTPYHMGTSCDTIDCATAPTRACCFLDDACVDLPPSDCWIDGGMPRGLGSSCDIIDCDCCGGQHGGGMWGTFACCFPDDACADLPPYGCMMEGGAPQGLGTSCDTLDCHIGPTTACCLPDHTCVDLPPFECMVEEGVPWGMGTSCGDIDCASAPTSACCFLDDTCADVPPFECRMDGGVPHGMGTSCATVDCDIHGGHHHGGP